MLQAHLPDASISAIAPGRVNLLGEHVDYNDGPVLPAAIDRAVHLAAARGPDRQVHLHALDLDQSICFAWRADRKTGCEGNPLPCWALYPAGVAWVLQNRRLLGGRNAGGLHLRGAYRRGAELLGGGGGGFCRDLARPGGWRLTR